MPKTIYIAVSDIHLNTNRVSADPNIDHPDGERFKHFLQDLKTQAETLPKDTHLALVLNGDILDILSAWDEAPYPWELKNNPQATENRLKQVVSAIIQSNLGVFQALKALLERPNTTIHYITGNHDQWLWPSKKAQDLLAQAMGATSNPATLQFHQDEWQVGKVALFTHGHTLDKLSVSSTLDASPWGDYVTIFLINRFRIHLRDQLQAAGTSPSHIQKTLQEVQELDHLPLFWDAPGWQKTLSRKDPKLAPLMKEAEHKAFEELITAACDKLKLSPESWRGKSLKRLLKMPGCFHLISGITALVEGWVHTNRSQKRFAQKNFSDTSPHIVVGHSHAPEQLFLGHLPTGEAGYYLNSGTWKRAFTPPNSLNRFLPRWPHKHRTPYSCYVRITEMTTGTVSAKLHAYDPKNQDSLQLEDP